MPNGAQDQWNPVQEFKQNWPNANLSDGEILKNLQDPAKFRSAFPHYTGVTDDEIRTKMKSYTPLDMPAMPKGDVRPSTAVIQTNATWDRIYNTYLPEALFHINKAITQPLSKDIGFKSFTDYYNESKLSKAPAGESPAVDTLKLAARTAAGIGDFIQSPAGVAATGLTTATGGTAAPYLAAGFAAGQAPEVIDAIKIAHQNPTPENVQEALFQTSMIPGMLAGGKVIEKSGILPHQEFVKGGPVLPRGTLKDIPGSSSTQLGPIDSAKQTLHIEAPAKAPIEAHAPQVEVASKSFDPAVFIGKEAPIRPYDPTGTRFARGETIGLGPISGGKPAVPDFTLDYTNLAKDAGLVYKGELVKGSDVHMFEDPSKPGQTMAIAEKDIPLDEPKEYLRRRMDAKLKEFEEKPAPVIPETPVPSPVSSSALVKELVSRPKSFYISDQLNHNLDLMANLSLQADAAESDAQRGAIISQRESIASQSRALLRKHVGALNDEQLLQFRDKMTTQADTLRAQGDAIRELTEATIKNRGIKREIADLRSTGGPVREMIVSETGERAVIKPEADVSRGGRSILDELQGRVPTSEFESLQVAGKPEGVSDAEWAKYVDTLQRERQNIKKQISDAVTIASETGVSLSDMGIEDHVDRLQEIESLLGKYTEPAKTGRRPSVAPTLGEKGEIQAPETLKSWTLERARLALGNKVKQMPTDEEFFQHADLRHEKARLYQTVADVAQKVIDRRKQRSLSQRGAVGEIPSGLTGKVKIASLKEEVPNDQEMIKRAKALGYEAFEISDDKPGPYKGFISSDGKYGISSGYLMHDDLASSMLPNLFKWGNALRAMLDKGWIRKASSIEFEAWHLDEKTISTIEMSTLRDGKYGQRILIDTRGPRGIRALHIESGWEDLTSAINKGLREQGFREAGRIGGIEPLVGATTGGLIGGITGAHIAGPLGAIIGGAIGWGAGFMTPVLARQHFLFTTLNGLRPRLASMGITMRDWMMGPPQADPINPNMRAILDAQQRDVRGPVKSILQRIAQLPGNIQSALFDKFIFINDRPGAMVNFLMKFDQRGRAFRDLRGRIDVDNSPYVSAWLAAGGGGGMAEAHLLDYKRMYSEAQNKGLVNNLNEYLNLVGYQRVYDVMQERIRDHDQNIGQLKQQLQQPNLRVEDKVDLNRALKAAQSDRQDVINKLTSKSLVPDPYDPPKIANDLGALQAGLGPRKFADVQTLANRVFALNRKVLDMIHDSGIIDDAEYQKYVERGDEYIPMHRILEQISDGTANTHGKGSPLYLRQQNVIKALMGSERINRDPIIASADANLEALREVLRNGVIKDYIKLAIADPSGIGSYFKRVGSGYKTAIDEGIVGVYEGGVQHSFAVPTWLAESLKNVSPSAVNMIGKGPLRYFGQLLRKGATAGNLAWSIPNALRHLGDMAIMSDAGLKDIRTLPRDVAGLLKDWTRSLYGSAIQDPAWREYMRSGAAYSTLQRMISPEDHLNLDAIGFKQKVAKGRIIDAVQDFNAAVEDATKMTTFRRLREAGYTEKAAAWETRRYGGGPDFARQGNFTPAVNLASMFFNAHLQYVTRVFARAKENPGRIAVALGAITMMAMTLNEHNWNQHDEKGNQLLRKVPFTDRENNFVILTGDTYESSTGATLPVYYKIPKPSFVKFLYNPIENTLNKMAGHEERTGVQLGLQAAGNLMPGQMDLQQGEIGKSAVRGAVSSLNPIIRAPLEEAMNYTTTGFGRPIVPSREASIDPRFQYGPSTSEMAKRVGEGGVRGAVAGATEGGVIGYLIAGGKGAAIGGGIGSIVGSIGVSPRRAEHVIDTTTAGVGKIATGLVDPFLGGVRQTRMEGQEKLGQTPVFGPIARRFISTPIDQQERTLTEQFYRSTAEAKIPMATLKFLEKNHPEQVPRYIQANKNELWKGQLATTMEARLGQISNAERMVEQNVQMKDSDKAAALKNLHEVRMRILQVFNGVLRPSPQVGQAVTFPGQGQGAPR